MNNFPAMTEERRQALIKMAKRLSSGVEGNLIANLAKVALAALTAEPHYHTMVGNYYTAPPVPVLRVPAGWKLVPMVPTEAMIMAAQDSEDVLFDKDDDSLFIVDHKEIYRAMLENAPEASNEQ